MVTIAVSDGAAIVGGRAVAIAIAVAVAMMRSAAISYAAAVVCSIVGGDTGTLMGSIAVVSVVTRMCRVSVACSVTVFVDPIITRAIAIFINEVAASVVRSRSVGSIVANSVAIFIDEVSTLAA